MPGWLAFQVYIAMALGRPSNVVLYLWFLHWASFLNKLQTQESGSMPERALSRDRDTPWR